MKDLIVQDNFLKDPYAVRQFALTKVRYLRPEQREEGLAGLESAQGYYSKSIIERFERLVGEKIIVDPRRFSFGVFAKTFVQDVRRQEIHVDATKWTGILYLSKSQDCQGGTNFYRHKKFGFDKIPSDTKIREMGYVDRNEFLNRFLPPISSADVNHWELSLFVAMKFNRLVLFKAGEYFHSAGALFGTDDESCRLIQLFFFNTQAGGS